MLTFYLFCISFTMFSAFFKRFCGLGFSSNTNSNELNKKEVITSVVDNTSADNCTNPVMEHPLLTEKQNAVISNVVSSLNYNKPCFSNVFRTPILPLFSHLQMLKFKNEEQKRNFKKTGFEERTNDEKKLREEAFKQKANDFAADYYQTVQPELYKKIEEFNTETPISSYEEAEEKKYSINAEEFYFKRRSFFFTHFWEHANFVHRRTKSYEETRRRVLVKCIETMVNASDSDAASSEPEVINAQCPVNESKPKDDEIRKESNNTCYNLDNNRFFKKTDVSSNADTASANKNSRVSSSEYVDVLSCVNNECTQKKSRSKTAASLSYSSASSFSSSSLSSSSASDSSDFSSNGNRSNRSSSNCSSNNLRQEAKGNYVLKNNKKSNIPVSKSIKKKVVSNATKAYDFKNKKVYAQYLKMNRRFSTEKMKKKPTPVKPVINEADFVAIKVSDSVKHMPDTDDSVASSKKSSSSSQNKKCNSKRTRKNDSSLDNDELPKLSPGTPKKVKMMKDNFWFKPLKERQKAFRATANEVRFTKEDIQAALKTEKKYAQTMADAKLAEELQKKINQEQDDEESVKSYLSAEDISDSLKVEKMYEQTMLDQKIAEALIQNLPEQNTNIIESKDSENVASDVNEKNEWTRCKKCITKHITSKKSSSIKLCNKFGPLYTNGEEIVNWTENQGDKKDSVSNKPVGKKETKENVAVKINVKKHTIKKPKPAIVVSGAVSNYDKQKQVQKSKPVVVRNVVVPVTLKKPEVSTDVVRKVVVPVTTNKYKKNPFVVRKVGPAVANTPKTNSVAVRIVVVPAVASKFKTNPVSVKKGVVPFIKDKPKKKPFVVRRVGPVVANKPEISRNVVRYVVPVNSNKSKINSVAINNSVPAVANKPKLSYASESVKKTIDKKWSTASQSKRDKKDTVSTMVALDVSEKVKVCQSPNVVKTKDTQTQWMDMSSDCKTNNSITGKYDNTQNTNVIVKNTHSLQNVANEQSSRSLKRKLDKFYYFCSYMQDLSNHYNNMFSNEVQHATHFSNINNEYGTMDRNVYDNFVEGSNNYMYPSIIGDKKNANVRSNVTPYNKLSGNSVHCEHTATATSTHRNDSADFSNEYSIISEKFSNGQDFEKYYDDVLTLKSNDPLINSKQFQNSFDEVILKQSATNINERIRNTSKACSDRYFIRKLYYTSVPDFDRNLAEQYKCLEMEFANTEKNTQGVKESSTLNVFVPNSIRALDKKQEALILFGKKLKEDIIAALRYYVYKENALKVDQQIMKNETRRLGTYTQMERELFFSNAALMGYALNDFLNFYKNQKEELINRYNVLYKQIYKSIVKFEVQKRQEISEIIVAAMAWEELKSKFVKNPVKRLSKKYITTIKKKIQKVLRKTPSLKLVSSVKCGNVIIRNASICSNLGIPRFLKSSKMGLGGLEGGYKGTTFCTKKGYLFCKRTVRGERNHGANRVLEWHHFVKHKYAKSAFKGENKKGICGQFLNTEGILKKRISKECEDDPVILDPSVGNIKLVYGKKTSRHLTSISCRSKIGKQKTMYKKRPLNTNVRTSLINIQRQVQETKIDKERKDTHIDRPIDPVIIQKPVEETIVEKERKDANIDRPTISVTTQTQVEEAKIEKKRKDTNIDRRINPVTIQKQVEETLVEKKRKDANIDRPTTSVTIQTQVDKTKIEKKRKEAYIARYSFMIAMKKQIMERRIKKRTKDSYIAARTTSAIMKKKLIKIDCEKNRKETLSKVKTKNMIAVVYMLKILRLIKQGKFCFTFFYTFQLRQLYFDWKYFNLHYVLPCVCKIFTAYMESCYYYRIFFTKENFPAPIVDLIDEILVKCAIKLKGKSHEKREQYLLLLAQELFKQYILFLKSDRVLLKKDRKIVTLGLEYVTKRTDTTTLFARGTYISQKNPLKRKWNVLKEEHTYTQHSSVRNNSWTVSDAYQIPNNKRRREFQQAFSPLPNPTNVNSIVAIYQEGSSEVVRRRSNLIEDVANIEKKKVSPQTSELKSKESVLEENTSNHKKKKEREMKDTSKQCVQVSEKISRDSLFTGPNVTSFANSMPMLETNEKKQESEKRAHRGNKNKRVIESESSSEVSDVTEESSLPDIQKIEATDVEKRDMRYALREILSNNSQSVGASSFASRKRYGPNHSMELQRKIKQAKTENYYRQNLELCALYSENEFVILQRKKIIDNQDAKQDDELHTSDASSIDNKNNQSDTIPSDTSNPFLKLTEENLLLLYGKNAIKSGENDSAVCIRKRKLSSVTSINCEKPNEKAKTNETQ